MNKGISWQRAVATEDRKHRGLLYPGHADSADSSTQGLFPFCLLQYPPAAPSDLCTQFHSIALLQFMWTGWLVDWKGIMGSWPMVEWERVLSGTSFLAFTIAAQPQKMSCQTAGIIIYCHSLILLMHRNVLYWPDCDTDPFQIHHLKNSWLPCNATQSISGSV